MEPEVDALFQSELDHHENSRGFKLLSLKIRYIIFLLDCTKGIKINLLCLLL